MQPSLLDDLQQAPALEASHCAPPQEDLKQALAWTYSEYRKNNEQVAALDKRCTEMETAHQLETASSMREWKGKLEASQTLCRARGLRVNELEVRSPVSMKVSRKSRGACE